MEFQDIIRDVEENPTTQKILDVLKSANTISGQDANLIQNELQKRLLENEYLKDRLSSQRAAPTSLNNVTLTDNSSAYREAVAQQQGEILEKVEGNIVIFGHTGTGKTTFVNKLMAFNKLDPFDMFVYVKHMATNNKVDDLNDVRNIAVSKMILDGKSEEDANEGFIFFRDYQTEQAIKFCEHEKPIEKRVVIFFDDSQVGEDVNGIKKNLAYITNFMGRCRKVNTQVIITIHKNFDDTKNLRGEANVLVMINPDKNTFNHIIQEKIDNPFWPAAIKPTEKSDKGAILVLDGHKLYNLQFKQLVPLIPN